MLLAVDVGNTNTSIGVFEGEALRCELRLATRRNWTRDEFAIALERALALQGYGFAAIADAVIASVVPPVQGPLVEALRRYVGVQALVVGPGVEAGMPVRYDPPKDVGADRIVAAVAAHRRYGRSEAGEALAVIVVDFGTATTFDVISATPEYLGGVIAPGVGISADALFARAAKLPRVDVVKPATVIGRNTVDAMQSGLFYGYVGLVEGMLARIRGELGNTAQAVATGGLARKVAHETQAIDHVDDSLMLEGLRLLWEMNSGRA
ncbi:type III pantothenate kinase [Pseudenhygromyxa sp. WMMC2535]|uniref:type III pantothenate kinase n=1 Tax=Pseudenhygromyxa sp. WMMC2535 TaxID=2712867 RepID=UPI001555D1E4|nr:type III pantothenate kinase [Pseudenhygromyxa sp. WMMC2535]NVB38499.1 type III pantothenate kinase [Pseudenhygromyxa sp. WMMC2535]